MSKRFLVVAVGLVLLLGACGNLVSGSGNVVTREESLSGFDAVEASASFQVSIRQGESFRVVVRVDDNIVPYLRVDKEGSTLRLGLRPNSWVTNATLQAEVVMPELSRVEASGASRVAISGFRSARDLVLEVSGASTVEGDIQSADVTMEVSGASTVRLTGTGQGLQANVSGASTVDLRAFPVRDADVEVSGASSATVVPSGRLDVEASGASHVYYVGNPTMGRIETSGASSIEQR